jgi:hypothetical protein
MSAKKENDIKNAVLEAKKNQTEFFKEESDKEKEAFLEAYRKEMGLDNIEPKKVMAKKLFTKKIVIAESEDEEEDINNEPLIDMNVTVDEAVIIETVLEPVIKSVLQETREEKIQLKPQPVIKSVLQESREVSEPKQKLITVKKAPYDLKPSNEKLKIEELNTKLVEMQEKYNALMKKYNARGEEIKQLKKENNIMTNFIDKQKPQSVIEKLTAFIESNYEITTDRKDKIKCNEIYTKFFTIDPSYSQQGFIKELEKLSINKCQKNGINHFVCIKEKQEEGQEGQEGQEGHN